MRTLLAFILSLFPFFGIAQSLFSVKHYSMHDGLSHNMTKNFIQDDKGFIWVSTWNGIDRFDGYSFKNFKSYQTDKVKLGNNRIEHITKSSKNNIWLQTYDRYAYLFDPITEKFNDLLPSVQVQSIIPLQKGITWIVADNGDLYRIDENKVFDSDNVYLFSRAIGEGRESIIYNICLDSDGDEWLLTNRGITIVGDKKISNSMRFEHFVEIDKNIYLASADGYLAQYNTNGQVTSLPLPIQPRNINKLQPLQDGKLAILNSSEIIVYNPSNKEYNVLRLEKDKGSIEYSKVFQDSKGFIWAFTTQNIIIRFDPKNNKSLYLACPTLFNTKNNKSASLFHEDEYGYIWAITKEGILTNFNPEKKAFEIAYINNDKTEEPYVTAGRSYFIDTQKNVWINKRDGFDYLSFKKKDYDRIYSAKNREVRGLLKKRDGQLWLGTKNNTIEIYDKDLSYIGNLTKDGKIKKDTNVLFGSGIYSFFEDSSGNVWMGSKYEGLFLLTPKATNSYSVENFLPNEFNEYSISSKSIYSIFQDSHKRIWIGTYGGGLNLIELNSNGKIQFINYHNRLKNYPLNTCSNIRCLYETDNGIFMIGTTGGLLTFDIDFKLPEEITFFRNIGEVNRIDCLSNNDIMNIDQNKDGTIYLSTFSGGIDITNPSDLLNDKIEFRNYNKTNGLNADLILSTIADNNSTRWIASVNSIVRFHQSDKTFEAFNQNRLENDIEISEAAPILDEVGNVIFGTTDGALRILVDKINKSTFIPPIAFTGISIQNLKRKQNKTINIEKPELLSDERNITISFAALDYSSSDAIKYAYRLQGASDEWIYIDKNKSASFINLPAGHYTFQVKSTNGDGVWVDNIASIPIHVKPVFWETGWAWLLYTFIFILVATSTIYIILYILDLRRRVDFEQQLTHLKLKFFTDISHELRTPLTLIVSPIDEIVNNEPLSDTAKKSMLTVKRNTERMLRLVNQILDFRKIQNNKMKVYLEQVDIKLLVEKVYQSFLNISNQKQIVFDLIFEADRSSIYTDADKLEKILFNLVSNAFKYTPNGKRISLDIKIKDEELLIYIKDEGSGIDVRKIDSLFNRFETTDVANPNISSGIGLSLVKELVSLLQGKIDVNTTKGKGCTFVVKLSGKYETFKDNPLVEFILSDSNDVNTIQDEKIEIDNKKIKTSVLIIEDNDELRHFVTSILNKDYHVLEAENGKQGLEITLKENPDIVISDIMMPEMNGVEYLNNIKSKPETSHIPVILLTAKSSIEDQVEGLKYGADDYITKPFNSIYLKSKILALLKQREILRDYYLSKNHAIEDQKQSKKEWEPSVPKITDYDDNFICNVIQIIEDNIENTDFKIDNLSDAMNISRAVFYRKVKAIVGLSPIDFVKKIRIKRAMQLLQSDHFTIAEVAYKSGFTTPQYMSKVFKELMGCSPSEYKNSLNEKK